MSGRFTGEFWSRDVGLAIAVKRRAFGRFRWEVFVLVGRTSLTIGIGRVHTFLRLG